MEKIPHPYKNCSLYKPVCDITESYELSSCKLMMNLQSDSAPCDSAKNKISEVSVEAEVLRED